MIEPIGSGRFGQIFLALDGVSDTQVAIKTLKPHGIEDRETARRRFLREMKVIDTLVHNNIVTLYDYGESENGEFFMVLEYLEGETLRERLDRESLSATEAVDVVRQVALALETAHQCDVIHRDLKPENIMLVDSEEGFTVKVFDFGLAKLMSEISSESEGQVTRPGSTVGTPGYVAPEQTTDMDVGPWTDVYALGLIFYEILTGEPAIQPDSVEEALETHRSPEPLELPKFETTPDGIQPILRDMTRKSPKNRYTSARDMAKDLDQLEYLDRSSFTGSLGVAVDPDTGKIITSGPDSPGSTSDQNEDNESLPDLEELTRTDELELQWSKKSYENKSQDEDKNRSQMTGEADEEVAEFIAEKKQKSSKKWKRLIFLKVYGERALSVLVFLFAFWVLSLSFPSLDATARTAVGLTPVIFSFVLRTAKYFFPSAKTYTLRRVIASWSLTGVLVVHILKPGVIRKQLGTDPYWFATHVPDFPMSDQLNAVGLQFAQMYANLLGFIV